MIKVLKESYDVLYVCVCVCVEVVGAILRHTVVVETEAHLVWFLSVSV